MSEDVRDEAANGTWRRLVARAGNQCRQARMQLCREALHRSPIDSVHDGLDRLADTNLDALAEAKPTRADDAHGNDGNRRT